METSKNYAAVQESAQLFATSEYKGGELLAKFLGATPTYDQWETARMQWIKAYAESRAKVSGDCTPEASQKAWERAASLLKAFFELEKPKAPSKSAVVKAESRAKAKTEAASIVAKLVKADATPMQVSERAAELLKAGKIAEARILTDEAVKRQRASETAAKTSAKKASAETRKALTETIRKAEGPELMAYAYAASHKAAFMAWFESQVAATPTRTAGKPRKAA